MNKTVSINLGGVFFYIDEDAYQKLNRYFDAIEKSLSADGRAEIMNDIESRISELFSEKKSDGKDVIGLKEVDDVIAIMGQPEDYKIEDDEPKKSNYNYTSRGNKKLYRDTENGVLGGVSAGLGHYFGVDKVWIRLAIALLVIGFGTGLLAYLILWIVIPEAKTTSEKLDMRGEPITISNIEKKIREEFDNVSDKFKNADYDKMGNHVKSSAEKIGNALGDVLPKLFGAFGKILGAFLVFITASALIGLIIGGFTVGTFSVMDTPWLNYPEAQNFSSIPFWLVSLLGIIAIAIPFFFLLILGLKLLIPNLRSIGNTAKYSLLALWIIAVLSLIAFGIKQGVETAFEGSISEKRDIRINPTDTLKISYRFNDMYAKGIGHDNYELVQDASNKEFIYSNDVSIEILPTTESYAYIQVEKRADGRSLRDAKNRAGKIQYSYQFTGNQLILDNYILTASENKSRNQEVRVYLYLPKGTLFQPNESVEEYDRSDNEFFNLHHSSDEYVYQVEKKQVKCLNCPPEENDYDDVDNDEGDFNIDIEGDDDNGNNEPTSVIINENGIKIKKDTLNSNAKDFNLKINKDGIIIKTK
jgi:phage shock protein PspC (stress-responsive transcriptional regulator)